MDFMDGLPLRFRAAQSRRGSRAGSPVSRATAASFALHFRWWGFTLAGF